MIKNLFISLLFFSSIIAQTDWVKWSAVEISYEIPRSDYKKYSIDKTNIGSVILSGAQNAYYFFISDLDGDNCPFHPSCSNFFVQAVRETNIFQGVLMFADRFTRDSNFFKRRDDYPIHSSRRFYDPVTNYELQSKKIKFLPTNQIVD